GRARPGGRSGADEPARGAPGHRARDRSRRRLANRRLGPRPAPRRAAARHEGLGAALAELPNQQRDVATAKALLRTAGFAGRVPMKIRNIVGFPALAAALPVIVDNLKEAGIDAAVETVDGGVWIKDWIVPQSPPTLNDWGGFVDPDQTFFRHFHSAPG